MDNTPGISLAERKAQEGRRTQRILRHLLCGTALLVALLGIALLALRWWPHSLPLSKLGELRPAMDFTLIRIAGHATGDARVFREAGQLRSVRFTVVDGTGSLSVSAENEQAKQLALFDRIPRAGDSLEVVGRLSMGADEPPTLRIQTGDALKLRRAEKGAPPMAAAHGLAEGAQALLTGTIVRFIVPRLGSEAPLVFSVREASGERQFLIWVDVYEQIADRDRLVPGTAIRARVTNTTFQGQLQLKLGRAADLEFITPPAAPPPHAAP